MGRCPVCWNKHVYPRKFQGGSIPWPSRRRRECSTFRDLNPTQRANLMEDLGGCVTCLSWTHTNQECSLKEQRNPDSGAASVRCQGSEGTEICGRAHHRILYGSKSKYADADFWWGTPGKPGEFRRPCLPEGPWALS